MMFLHKLLRSARDRWAHAGYQLRAPARYIRRRRVESARGLRTTFAASMPGISCKMIIDPYTYFSEVYVRGLFEPEIIQYLKKTLRPGMTCVDIGANVGYLTLLMAAKVGPLGRVIAFEPTSSICELLKANVALNGYQQVVVEQAALSDHVGVLQFHEGPAGFDVYNSAGVITHPGAMSQPFVMSQVSCLTLDGYLSRLQWPRVDLIKIDVEGGELFVLKGMDEVLKSSPEIKLIIEFDDRTTRGFGYSANDTEDWLRERGWCLSIVGPGGKPLAVPANHTWMGQIVVADRSGNNRH